jgi:hypothetical protein
MSLNLSKQSGRDIPASVNWNCGLTTVRMFELLVRASLPNEHEAESLEEPNDLPGLEHREITHLCNPDLSCADELTLKGRFAVLQQHGDDLLQIILELLHRLGLCMSAGEPRYIPNERPRVRVPLNHRRIDVH